jgi:hypothetical protein
MVGAGTSHRMASQGVRAARRQEPGIPAPIVALREALLPQRAPGSDSPRVSLSHPC